MSPDDILENSMQAVRLRSRELGVEEHDYSTELVLAHFARKMCQEQGVNPTLSLMHWNHQEKNTAHRRYRAALSHGRAIHTGDGTLNWHQSLAKLYGLPNEEAQCMIVHTASLDAIEKDLQAILKNCEGTGGQLDGEHTQATWVFNALQADFQANEISQATPQPSSISLRRF